MDPVRVPKMFDKLALARITFDFPAWKDGRVSLSVMRCLVNDGELPNQASAAVRQELAYLKGNWRMQEMNGKKLPARGPADHVTIVGDRLQLRFELLGDGGKITVKNGLDAQLEIDPAAPVK